MDKIFIGVDRRQWLAFTVLQYSIYSRASKPVQVIPLLISQLPIQRRGLTDFSFSRYLVPWLCQYEGRALFIDADFLCLDDINRLFDEFDENAAAQVVKSKHRFEWASLILFNCSKCTDLTVDYVNDTSSTPQELEWGDIGKLPAAWNYLVGYDAPHAQQPSMVHYTQGIPGFLEMQGTPFFEEWQRDLAAATHTCSWIELMGQSIHAKPVVERLEIQRKLRVAALGQR